uniref:Putative nuclease HARBI1 n=1 Tax=Anopheles gambiae TaxID=7165 RepID=A0A499FX21_ANOGA
MFFIMFSDDDEIQEKRDLRNKRRILRKKADPFKLSDTAFLQCFRVTKPIFSFILEKIEPQLECIKSNGVSAKIKLAACLIFFGEGRYQHGTGQDFHVAMAQTTFSNTLRDLIPPLITLLGDWIQLNMTESERMEAKQYFFERSGISDVVMCVDGTHIRIVKPKYRPLRYINRKNYYSLNAMIVCDHKYRIRAADARFAGSHHDAYIWSVSPIRKHFRDLHSSGITDKLLGDAGYPSEPWLITPNRNPDSGTQESIFNTFHARGRNIVERTIGILKSKFRCLLGADGRLNYSPKKCTNIINICCALHNICIENNIGWQQNLDEMFLFRND